MPTNIANGVRAPRDIKRERAPRRATENRDDPDTSQDRRESLGSFAPLSTRTDEEEADSYGWRCETMLAGNSGYSE